MADDLLSRDPEDQVPLRHLFEQSCPAMLRRTTRNVSRSAVVTGYYAARAADDSLRGAGAEAGAAFRALADLT